MSIKVGINGFGVIGRRVAYAVNKQEDMELIGVGKTSPDYKQKSVLKKVLIFSFLKIAIKKNLIKPDSKFMAQSMN